MGRLSLGGLAVLPLHLTLVVEGRVVVLLGVDYSVALGGEELGCVEAAQQVTWNRFGGERGRGVVLGVVSDLVHRVLVLCVATGGFPDVQLFCILLDHVCLHVD